ncbi:4-carboxymuconolactone decarboxylase family protein [Aspergillus caelatus]|uniref:4-carboxymuconolactone decarboxylase family protein n=2 Tax=Aspergillus subgen. Circumdati TaxID=2720871 RepID=A0A5N6ZJI0_9EURO|nr:4-carboxymuconolactone decarboxylase family protein [Aspergillus caelatus]KAE8357528.1 4-carboxymuconolactone decarboxylase family protein [Aspergillus caelatus]KAE8418162.1 4-carboxymuconolactone decarboxylase family protein [Aspergillus pseudocaelatus]
MRIPYVPNPPPTTTPEEAEVLSRVQTRRGEKGLIPLDLALLHSFPVADGWNSFIGAIRTRTSLSQAIRELIICRIAVVNGAWFEWDQHSPLLLEGGCSADAVEVVRNAQADILQKVQEKVLRPEEAAVLKYTDAMTKTVTVPEEVFQELKRLFNDREVVEITATAAAYNCVSRFLVALDVGEKNH